MNAKESQANKQHTEYIIQDLNRQLRLSHIEDDLFDVICNVVLVNYLKNPWRYSKKCMKYYDREAYPSCPVAINVFPLKQW